MVSGLNHLHIDAGEMTSIGDTGYFHILSTKEKDAYNACLNNNKPIYLTLHAIIESVEKESSFIMALDIRDGERIYNVMTVNNHGTIMYLLGSDPEEGAILTISVLGAV